MSDLVGRISPALQIIVKIIGTGPPGPPGPPGASDGSQSIRILQCTADLLAANWTGGSAPFVQTISVEGVTAENAVSVGLSQNATDSQTQMYGMCGVYAYSQASGQLTFRARYEKPAETLPVTVFIFG